MIIQPKDPATMTREARLQEIVAILARGYLRSLSRKELDDRANSEPSCHPVVNGQKNNILEDVA
ncbi:MAG: hypothetical protein KJ645_10735 [Planctomycetes bacterium]|nr:hypothetical protein [Planctomycetota bacterium]